MLLPIDRPHPDWGGFFGGHESNHQRWNVPIHHGSRLYCSWATLWYPGHAKWPGLDLAVETCVFDRLQGVRPSPGFQRHVRRQQTLLMPPQVQMQHNLKYIPTKRGDENLSACKSTGSDSKPSCGGGSQVTRSGPPKRPQSSANPCLSPSPKPCAQGLRLAGDVVKWGQSMKKCGVVQASLAASGPRFR
jgi:hypothetical protein